MYKKQSLRNDVRYPADAKYALIHPHVMSLLFLVSGTNGK